MFVCSVRRALLCALPGVARECAPRAEHMQVCLFCAEEESATQVRACMLSYDKKGRVLGLVDSMVHPSGVSLALFGAWMRAVRACVCVCVRCALCVRTRVRVRVRACGEYQAGC